MTSNIMFTMLTEPEPLVCDPPCVNGVCEENNHCDCMPGWTGIICDNGIVLTGLYYLYL